MLTAIEIPLFLEYSWCLKDSRFNFSFPGSGGEALKAWPLTEQGNMEPNFENSSSFVDLLVKSFRFFLPKVGRQFSLLRMSVGSSITF
jgi:hypothetical protein